MKKHLTGLRQKLSPNKAQIGFISSKHVTMNGQLSKNQNLSFDLFSKDQSDRVPPAEELTRPLRDCLKSCQSVGFNAIVVGLLKLKRSY
jgi:hypothetical protein